MLNIISETFDKNTMKRFCAYGSYQETIIIDNTEYTIVLCCICKKINFKSNKCESICIGCVPDFKK